MDLALNPNSSGGLDLDFTAPQGVMNNLILSLTTRRGSLFSAPEFGSRLHELKKDTAATRALIPDYVAEALRWMVDLGRIQTPVVEVLDSDVRGRVLVRVTAVQPSGQTISFETFVFMS